jgi:BirA family biotin operon repressor/biotin-[acetyl-CoA-carboxylase] ligase
MTWPADLDPAAIAAGLRTKQLGRSALRVVPATGSTNQDLLAEAGAAPHGATLIADHQTAGRGRRQRAWWNEPGKDLLLSVLLRPDVAAERLPSLTLAAGLAACETVSRALGRAADLKWPNDVLLGGKKICGILCQSALTAPPAAVVGFGVNVNSAASARPAELQPLAVSLLDATGAAHDRGKLAAALLNDFEAFYDQWLADRAALFQMWAERARLLGRKLRVAEEGRTYAATAVGIDEEGRLLVAVAGERRTIASGDVFFAEE